MEHRRFWVVNDTGLTNCGADNAERPRQARSHHEHDDGADDGEDNLRLDDRHLALGRAFPPRPERQHTRKASGDRQPGQRVLEIANLLLERGCPLEHVGPFGFLLDLIGRLRLRERRRGDSGDKRGREKQDAQSGHRSSRPS